MSKEFHPKVSIVIPVYNGSNYVKEAIDSALNQTYDNVEVIVVNDGSTDGGKTDEICRSYGKKIRYFFKENGGVASALNMGIEKMEGEYFSWLSHDDVYYPEKVEKQIEALSKLKNKETIIYSNVEYINESSETIYKTKYEEIYTKKQLRSGIFPALKGLTNGCAMMISKRLFSKEGGFNEKYIAVSDYDMWFRLFSRYSIEFLPLALTKYRLHGLQGTKTMNKKKLHSQSDKVWASVIKKIDRKQIEGFGVNPIDFLVGLAYQMQRDSRMMAEKEAFKKAKYYYEREKRKVSIVMPCYNAEKYLKESIESILHQTYSNFELIIVDDASTDKSWDVISQYAKRDFRILCLKNINGKGVAGTMNTGIERASGEYLARMDADDISIENRLEVQVSFLEKNKKYDFCSVNMSAFGEIENPKLYKEKHSPLEWQFLWSNPMASASTIYRLGLIRKHNIRFQNYKVASDYDFLCQLLPYGRPAMLYDEVLYKYRIHKKSIFQKNKHEALENSVIINKNLIKKLFGVQTPQFHYLLTSFRWSLSNKKELNIKEAVNWVYHLFELSKKKWKWTKKETEEVKKDLEKRLVDYFIYITIGDINEILEHKELEMEKLRISENLLKQKIEYLEEDLKLTKEDLKAFENSFYGKLRERKRIVTDKNWLRTIKEVLMRKLKK